MVFLNLFKTASIEQGMRCRKTIFGLKVNPLISGYNKRKLRYLFNAVDLPFIYNKGDIIGYPLSSNKLLLKRLVKKEEEKAMKLLKLRTSLAAAIEKTEKHRDDSYNKRKLTGIHKLLMESHQFLAGKSVSAITTVKEKSHEGEENVVRIVHKQVVKRPVSVKTGTVPSPSGVRRAERQVFKDILTKGMFNDAKETMEKAVKSKTKAKEEKEKVMVNKKELIAAKKAKEADKKI